MEPLAGKNDGVNGKLPSAPRLLVRVPSWLGDAVAAEPLLSHLADLRRSGQLAELSLAGPRHVLPVLAGVEPARRVPHSGRGGERAEDWRGHDAALLLTGSFRSAWTAWRAGIPERAGARRDGRGPWLSLATPVPRGDWWRGRRPEPEPVEPSLRRLWSAAAARWQLPAPAPERAPRLTPAPDVRVRVERRLAELGFGPGGAPRLWVNAGGRDGSAKAPPAERWVRLVAGLARNRDLRVGLLYGPGEEERVAAVRSGLAAEGVAATALWPEAAANLEDLIALCSAADLTLTSDTGPRHVARAAGSKTFTVFGSSDARHTVAHPSIERTWSTSASCAPCGQEHCRLPVERQLACFTEEPLDRQIEELDRWLREPRSVSGDSGRRP